jgi:hypothetical protein
MFSLGRLLAVLDANSAAGGLPCPVQLDARHYRAMKETTTWRDTIDKHIGWRSQDFPLKEKI